MNLRVFYLTRRGLSDGYVSTIIAPQRLKRRMFYYSSRYLSPVSLMSISFAFSL